MRLLKSILFAVVVVLSPMVMAANSAVSMLEHTANEIISTLKENKANLKSNPSIIYQAVEKYLLPIVDVEGMSRSVLGGKVWFKASTAQKTQFSQAFTRLVIRTYSSPLAEYSDETIQFLPARVSSNPRYMKVNSLIVRSRGENIQLTYSLVDLEGEWKIYDLSVEGVSLLQSFRSQFAQALKNSSIDEVIKLMQQKQLKRVS